MGRYLRALAKRGLTAREINGRLKVSPNSKLTDNLRAEIQANVTAILAELRNAPPPAGSPLIQAIRDRREGALLSSPWRDVPGQPPHDIDRLSEVMVEMFARCAAQRWEHWQYWEPPTPKPAQRPYCYVRAELVDEQWFYRPMIADTNGEDALWL